MPRLIALILILLVPLQFAWSAVAAVHGHVGEIAPALITHVHAHEHDDAHAHTDGGHPGNEMSIVGDTEKGHGDDGHHACHYHPVFSLLLADYGPMPTIAVPGGPIPHPRAAFHSRIPPLLDRPPLARA